jgi:hypothetical protein
MELDPQALVVNSFVPWHVVAVTLNVIWSDWPGLSLLLPPGEMTSTDFVAAL